MAHEVFFSPDEDLKQLWKKEYGGLEDKLNRIREEAVEEFARENDISRQEAWVTWRMATRPLDDEAIRQELTVRIVNMMYDISEAPWDDDYTNAREIASAMLRYSSNPDHRSPVYYYDDELAMLAGTPLGEQLMLTPEKMLYLGEFARSWSYSYSRSNKE